MSTSSNTTEIHYDPYDVDIDDNPYPTWSRLQDESGAALARLEGRVALEEILQRWPTWEVDTDEGKMAHTVSVRGWGYLPVRPHGN